MKEYESGHKSIASEFSVPGVHNRTIWVSLSQLLNFSVTQFLYLYKNGIHGILTM